MALTSIQRNIQNRNNKFEIWWEQNREQIILNLPNINDLNIIDVNDIEKVKELYKKCWLDAWVGSSRARFSTPVDMSQGHRSRDVTTI